MEKINTLPHIHKLFAKFFPLYSFKKPEISDVFQTKPFKSRKKSITFYEDKKSDIQLYVDSKGCDETFRPLLKTQLRKHTNETSVVPVKFDPNWAKPIHISSKNISNR
ncbi:hypothetical protein HZS_3464 [Henneguya salminicola]|nr:hypothetical protein HZS_3464 [Henneguya salminicola]